MQCGIEGKRRKAQEGQPMYSIYEMISGLPTGCNEQRQVWTVVGIFLGSFLFSLSIFFLAIGVRKAKTHGRFHYTKC
jgi:hypothetical protein